VARTGFFSRHSADHAAAAEEREADRDRRLAETAPTAAERTEAADRAAAEERRADEDRAEADERVRYPATTVPRDGAAATTAPVTTAPEDTEPAQPAAVPHVRAHTSALATVALVVGVAATCAALTGRLAPLAVVVGGLGALLAIGGLGTASRRGVTGHGVALLALLFSVGGIALGIMAINDTLPWLSSGTDHVAQVRDWFDAHLSWLKRF
jgi:hypothetical protein